MTLQNFTHQHRQVYLENQLILQNASFEIDEKVIEKIMNCKKSSLSLDGNSWSKKLENPLFKVTIRSYDVTEVCEFENFTC